METTNQKFFKVTDSDFVLYFQKASGAGRENPNFLFSGFTLADRASRPALQALLRAVIDSANHAEVLTGRKAIHTLTITWAHRILFIHTFGIKIVNGFAVVPSLKVSADFDANMPMYQWAWFEAAVKKAITMVK